MSNSNFVPVGEAEKWNEIEIFFEKNRLKTVVLGSWVSLLNIGNYLFGTMASWQQNVAIFKHTRKQILKICLKFCL